VIPLQTRAPTWLASSTQSKRDKSELPRCAVAVAVVVSLHELERLRLEALGKAAPYVDRQTAAIAYTNALTRVTANVKDFTRFKGLEVENWLKPGRR
jgi:hypothetical protein